MSGFAASAVTRFERSATSDKAPGSKFRPDIEGLRALAIGLVLLYHAGIKVVPGGFVGVDVFFVISGFLITGMLLRELNSSGRIALATFYARRVRRLVPAATVVLATTAMLVLAIGPGTQRNVFAGDIVASAVSLVNWRFAERSVDYQAEGLGASPVLHFWSLAVEEQFYVIWPLIAILGALVAVRMRRNPAHLAVGALSVVVVASLVWSVVATNDQPAAAFFVTTTRLWEMGIGALLAAAVPLVKKLHPQVARFLGWGGFAVIIASAFYFNSETHWPGANALVPTLGTAAVIAAGTLGAAYAPWPLKVKPAVWVGAISYSLYLWHWPLLIAAGWLWGEFGQKVGLTVVLASFVPAWLSYRFVENPFRRSKSIAASTPLVLSIGLNLVALSVIAALAVMLIQPAKADASVLADGKPHGAQVLAFDGEVVSGIDIALEASPYFPAAADARRDQPAGYDNGCHLDQQNSELSPCLGQGQASESRLVIVGDSKAAQWADALIEVGERNGIVVELATKSACPFVHADVKDGQGELYDSCLEYGDALEEALIADPPDYVVVSQGTSQALDEDGESSTQLMVDALVDRWSRLESSGIDVIVLSNNPSPYDLPVEGGQVPDCVLEYGDSLLECAFHRDEGAARSSAPTLAEAVLRVPAVDTLDMNDTLCDVSMCPPVIGGVLVYRQGSHITNTYALSTIEILEARLLDIVH